MSIQGVFVDALIGTIECVETGIALTSAPLANKFEKQQGLRKVLYIDTFGTYLCCCKSTQYMVIGVRDYPFNPSHMLT